MPSRAGFGFSSPVSGPGWTVERIARAWSALMERLGYERYGVQGGDIGGAVSPEVGRVDRERVVGVHVNGGPSLPPFRRPGARRTSATRGGGVKENAGVLTAALILAHDVGIRRYAERENTITRWTDADRGGHFAALEEPDLLVTDIREFFRDLRRP